MGIAIVAMVNNTAVGQNFKEKSQSCPEYILNSTFEDDALHGAQVCLFFKIFNGISKNNKSWISFLYAHECELYLKSHFSVSYQA